MKDFFEKIHTVSKAVLYAAYWTCVTTLLGASGLLLIGFLYTGRQMIYSAFHVVILGLFICLGIELNEKMKNS